MSMTEVQEVTNLLTRTKVIAIVGLSPKPDRPSHEIAQFLLARGYDIIPVNPACVEILGRPCYPDLAAVPRAVDMVDVFRKSEDVLPIAQDAIRCHSHWRQKSLVATRRDQPASHGAGRSRRIDRGRKFVHKD